MQTITTIAEGLTRSRRVPAAVGIGSAVSANRGSIGSEPVLPNRRPNPNYFRPAIFNFEDIQIGRVLSEDEVLQINYITKRRANRYIAAAEQEWLFPEKRVSTDHWRKLGDGYLLMPEPRLIYMGGEILIGYRDGHSDAFSPYGHKPWQPGYEDDKRERRESEALERFQAEWALTHGSKYTAYSNAFGGRVRESGVAMMAHYEEVRRKYRRRR